MILETEWLVVFPVSRPELKALPVMNWQIIIKFSRNKNSDKSFSTSSFDPQKFDSKFTARTQAFTREELTDYYQIFAKSKSRQIIQYFKIWSTKIWR